MPRTNRRKKKPGPLYEDIYVREYKPLCFAGSMPRDPRMDSSVFTVVCRAKDRGGLLFGPTVILWDALEHIPALGPAIKGEHT